jgi:hypothetical protein
MTTVPGRRGELFFDVSNVDPAMLTMEETQKDTIPLKALLEVPAAILNPNSILINVPVFILDGNKDILSCGGALDCSSKESFLQFESPFWSPAAKLEAFLLPNSGHTFQFHKNNTQAFAAMIDWSDRHFDKGKSLDVVAAPTFQPPTVP